MRFHGFPTGFGVSRGAQHHLDSQGVAVLLLWGIVCVPDKALDPSASAGI